MRRSPRREVLAQAAAFAALLAWGSLPKPALAESRDAAFDATSFEDALRALGGVPAAGTGITIDLPDLVENGAVVPIAVASTIPGTREIAIVAELNPYPVVARFRFPGGTEPFVSVRVKLAQSGRVYAIVDADGRLYGAAKETKVIQGGCG